MRILLLGGTAFLGRHLVEAALERGHEVTLFNRGKTNAELFPEVEKLIGDRDGQLEELAGRKWDAVIDTSGYLPRIVRQSARLLKEMAESYCYVSSISAYADFSAEEMDEASPLAVIEDEKSEDITAHYGALKALCEREVAEVFGQQAIIIRPGLIVGPHDPTGRFTYWPERFSEGGSILVPGQPERPIQFIDARDLAAWTIHLLESKGSGIYNAVSPAKKLTMGRLVEACSQLTDHSAAVWVSEPFLQEHGVGEWMELPLWLASSSNMPGFLAVSGERAARSGLVLRSIEATVRDTLEWVRSSGAHNDQARKAGLSKAREAELLDAWTKLHFTP